MWELTYISSRDRAQLALADLREMSQKYFPNFVGICPKYLIIYSDVSVYISPNFIAIDCVADHIRMCAHFITNIS